MNKLLCTFSGKTGDILWSLATIHYLWKRRLSLIEGGKEELAKIDFACMPQYEKLLPLIKAQPYISDAFILKDWICQGSPFGDQPWLPPTIPPNNYDDVMHLTYKYHPNGETLVDHIARQYMLKLPDICSPFIYVPEVSRLLFQKPTIVYGFNWMGSTQKDVFLKSLFKHLEEKGLEFTFVDSTLLDWLTAAAAMKAGVFFIGCRSANYVLAHGLGKKVLCFEPAPERRPSTFGFGSHGTECMPDVTDFQAFVKQAEEWLKGVVE